MMMMVMMMKVARVLRQAANVGTLGPRRDTLLCVALGADG